MVEETEKQHYREQVLSWMRRLNPEPLDPETVVWHYTRGDSLISILKSGALFSTQASCLNDSTELRYSMRLLRSSLVEIASTLQGEDPASNFVRDYLKMLNDSDDEPAHAGSMFFVSCFSLLGDDLSQWRSYSGGENGYAIGFQVQHLVDRNGLLGRYIGKVNYDAELHSLIATEVAEATVRFYREGLAKRNPAERETWAEDFLSFWDETLAWLAPVAKDPGFASEQEVRLIHPFTGVDLNRLVFIQRKALMSRHVPLTWPYLLGDKAILPIESVMIGPGRHKHISMVSVKTLLRQCGYLRDDLVAVSKLPYQEV